MEDVTYRGRLRQCLQHYHASRWNVNELSALAHFIGVTEKTVEGWCKGGPLPTGLRALKLLHYLALLGYDVEELRKQSDVVRPLSAAVALDVVDLLTLARELKFGGGDSSARDQVMQVLLHGRPLVPEKRHAASVTADSYRSAIEERRLTLRRSGLPTIVHAATPEQATSARHTGRVRSLSPSVHSQEHVAPVPVISERPTGNDRAILVATAYAHALGKHVEALIGSDDAAALEAFRQALGGAEEVQRLAENLLIIAMR